MSTPRVRDEKGRELVRKLNYSFWDEERRDAVDALDAHLDDRATALAACQAENERLREAYNAAVRYIELTPCDEDIFPDQYEAWHAYHDAARALTGDDR